MCSVIACGMVRQSVGYKRGGAVKLRVVVCIVIMAATATSLAGVKNFVGGAVLNTDWSQDANWNPAGQPTLQDTVYLAYSPYVAITGGDCLAHTVIIQNGGRLMLRKSDNARQLTVAHNFIVQAGGTFNTDGSPGTNGPLVYIGGDVYNAGTWDLSGVCAGNNGVIFNGAGTQHIYGPNPLTFQNLSNIPNDSLIVDGTHVGVLGYTNPLTGLAVSTINGGTFTVGGPPLPITLARFEAVVTADQGTVRLSWQTVSEIDNYGFTVERSPADLGAYQALGFVPSAGTGIAVRNYAFEDASVVPGRWSYRLRQTDLTGEESLSEPVSVTVAVVTSAASELVPAVTRLLQNYPNPFNPETTIRFSVAHAGAARLSVYDVTGKLVAVLFDGPAEAAQEYVVGFSATEIPTGSYYYRLEAGGRSEVRRMLLVR